MISYPLHFESSTESEGGMNSLWKTRSDQFESTCAIPKEFQGPGGGLSPEDLYNQALTNCFVATFKVYAENSKLTFDKLIVDSKLVVDLDDRKKPVMKEFHLVARIQNPSNHEKAMMLAKKASEAGFILNSVKTEKYFEIKVV
jgi:organic hydroperoxide reductase OsmC/OhrA